MNKPFTSVMKQFFGLLPGQTIGDFARELKDLSYEEKMQFYKMLTEDANIPCDPPTPTTK